MTTRTLELPDARRAGFYNIAEAAKVSGLSAKRIRHYELLGLLPEAKRTSAGYRLFDRGDVCRLRFLRAALEGGFSLSEIRQLLALWQKPTRSSSDVRRLAQTYMGRLDRKIDTLHAIRRTLAHLVAHVAGDQRPDCPVLDGGGDPVYAARRAGDADIHEHSSLSEKRLERGTKR